MYLCTTMAKKKKRRLKLRWGRIFTAVALIALIVVACFTHPVRKARLWHAERTHTTPTAPTDSIHRQAAYVDSLFMQPRHRFAEYDRQGHAVAHRVLSVSSFDKAFPDINDTHLATAQVLGISKPIENRAEAEKLTQELVYIGCNPYFDLRQPMTQSIPYLVPRAARLLTEIARAFQDSLVSKGLPMHKLMVSSVLRTEEDVRQLRRTNPNASENSCHRYGTTFDITYNNFTRVQDPAAEPLTEVNGVILKSVLAEVLRDQRELGTCYIKYEYKRPCFHITCR